MIMHSYGISDVGRRRRLNEDSFLRDDEMGLFIVADGVGGEAKGEIASAQAVEEIHGYVAHDYQTVQAYLRTPSTQNAYAVRRLLESAVQSACYMVFGMADLQPDHRGMSTTISAVLMAAPIGILAQVGDSRIYRLRDGQAIQLTEDHTLTNYRLRRGLITPQEAEADTGKNVITRAVGHRDYVEVDTRTCNIQPGDRFLLCSDGLHTYLQPEEPTNFLAGGTIEDAARSLVDLANQRGGQDNITVMIVDISE